MMTVDKILEWARGRGYTAVYGSAWQINEMLTDVDFAASKDATAVIMHLVTDSATVDGKDTAVVAVYFASLCDFDFDGEQLLPEQERLKGIGKELLNDIRTGNEMTYNDPRWQYGYDDYAENVCWVCLRVTLTASAADCVPLSPEPPTPPPGPEYDIFCPQYVSRYANYRAYPNPYRQDGSTFYLITVAVKNHDHYNIASHINWIGDKHAANFSVTERQEITESNIQSWKSKASTAFPMSQETEDWLRERIGRTLITVIETSGLRTDELVLASYSAINYESKPVTVI